MVTMQIWTNRLLKELDGVDSRLPSGVSLSSHDMEPEAGLCKAYFEASLAAPGKRDGGDDGDQGGGRADGEDPGGDEENDTDKGKPSSPLSTPPGTGEGKIDGERPPSPSPSKEGDGEGDGEGEAVEAAAPSLLQFKIEMDLGLDTRYPFESPVIRVLEGDEVIPTSILSGDDLLNLPGSDAWTPSSTIVNTLQDIVDMVLHASEAGLPTGHGGDDAGALERGELRPGALVGTESLLLFPCTPLETQLFSGSVLAPRSRRPLDRYVGVTDRQVLELEAHRTRMNKTVVTLAIPLSSLKKLKFRRGVSVTVILKNDETREFMTPQSYECVTAVTQRLEKMGIAGHQTTAGAERQVDRASSLMTALSRKEANFGVRETPDLAMVEECMDLFRQAAELYSAADDPRHEEVLAHMHRFLQREDVLGALVGGSSSNGAAENDVASSGGSPPAPEGGESSGGAPPAADGAADVSRAALTSTGEAAEAAGAERDSEKDTAAAVAVAAGAATTLPSENPSPSTSEGVEPEPEAGGTPAKTTGVAAAEAAAAAAAATPPPTGTAAATKGGNSNSSRKAPSTTGGGARGKSKPSPSGKVAGVSGRAGGKISPAGKTGSTAAAGADASKSSPRGADAGVGRGRGKSRGGGGGGRGSRGRGGGRGGTTSGTTGGSS